MKKVMAILTAMVLALGAGCTFAMAEEDISVPPSTPEMKAYESAWISEDGKTMVWIGRQDEGFQIETVQATGEDTFTSWEYLSNFDGETKSIKDAKGIKGDYKITEGKDELIEGSSVDDVEASFTLGEDGRLTWNDKQAGKETVLEKIGNFVGSYTYERGVLSFIWDTHENHYDIVATWLEEETEKATKVWDYTLVGEYDPKTETVNFKGLKQLLTYKDDGEIDTSAKVEEGELEGTFSFNENGSLVWKSSDGSEDGIVLENDLAPLWACIMAV